MLDNTIETFYSQDGKRRVRIEYDSDGSACDPRDDNDFVEIVTPELRRYNIATKNAHFQREHDALLERGLGSSFGRYLKIFHGIDAYPVYMYDHSAVALSIGSFVGRAQHAEWDSGQVGWAYINPDTAEMWEGIELEKVIASYVETLGQWMNGEVYGYVVERKVRVSKTTYYNEDRYKTKDSWEWVEDDDDCGCWGLIGYEWAEQAAKEALGEEELDG